MASVLSYESLVHAVAGAVGSMTAMTVFFPLDTARLRLQVDEKRKSKTTHMVLLEIIKEEGLLAPYRGWFPVISSLCCSNFVYFYTFNSLKAVWVKGQHSTTGKDLVVGFVAGVVNVLLTTPLWVVNTRLKLQGAKFRNEDIVPTNYSGIIDAFHQIIRDEGISALWNGTFPSLLLVFNPAIQFMFYEGLKRQLLKKRMKLSSLDVFIIGAIAKAIATTVTYPMQTVQSILRFGRHRLNPENRTLGSLRNVLYLLHQRVSRHTLVHHGVAPRRALGLLPDRGRLALRLATGRRKAVKSTGLSFQPGSAPFTFTGICLLLEYTFIRADGRQRNMGGEFWKEKLLSSTWS
ncbi:peroxisomal membrane protein PMP34 isoform X1 [Camelus dromedarius]|uniref:Peroxisomal membrane protein PMP34 n=3 Tax=Artiodactyla TaxID=91561 RepID=A0A8B8U0U9_CAMFR|nr:peroxisomal membrane protein PMP34 isoform X1 [Camelus dromedarius]XP_032348201.1 peroxisomal membrane protein PMP34 isoform X1 [Camelus ferus]XP_045376585.1 peroxisomal membrane protein PMP34 isoform X2 [Camelus bactrianus]